MGTALMMEGLLSACYHVCPNYTNFQFGRFTDPEPPTAMFKLGLGITESLTIRYDTRYMAPDTIILQSSSVQVSFIHGSREICLEPLILLIKI